LPLSIGEVTREFDEGMAGVGSPWVGTWSGVVLEEIALARASVSLSFDTAAELVLKSLLVGTYQRGQAGCTLQ